MPLDCFVAFFVWSVLSFGSAAAPNRTTTVAWQLERSMADHSNVYSFPFAPLYNYNNGGIMYTTKPRRKFSNIMARKEFHILTIPTRYLLYIDSLHAAHSLTNFLCNVSHFRRIQNRDPDNSFFECATGPPVPSPVDLDPASTIWHVYKNATTEGCVRVHWLSSYVGKVKYSKSVLCRISQLPTDSAMSRKNRTLSGEHFAIVSFPHNSKIFSQLNIPTSLCMLDLHETVSACRDTSEKQTLVMNTLPFQNATVTESMLDTTAVTSRRKRSSFVPKVTYYDADLEHAMLWHNAFVDKTQLAFTTLAKQAILNYGELSNIRAIQWARTVDIADVHYSLLLSRVDRLFTQISLLAQHVIATFHIEIKNPHAKIYFNILKQYPNADLELPFHAQFHGFSTSVLPDTNGYYVEVKAPPFPETFYSDVRIYHTELDCLSLDDITVPDPKTNLPRFFPASTPITDIISVLHPTHDYPRINFVAFYKGKPFYLDPSCDFQTCLQDFNRSYVVPFEHLLMPFHFRCNYTETFTLSSNNGFSLVMPRSNVYDLYTCLANDPLTLPTDTGMLSVNTGTAANEMCTNSYPFILLPNSTNAFQIEENQARPKASSFHPVFSLDKEKARIMAALYGATFPDLPSRPSPFPHKRMSTTLLSLPSEAFILVNKTRFFPEVVQWLQTAADTVTATATDIFNWPQTLWRTFTNALRYVFWVMALALIVWTASKLTPILCACRHAYSRPTEAINLRPIPSPPPSPPHIFINPSSNFPSPSSLDSTEVNRQLEDIRSATQL